MKTEWLRKLLSLLLILSLVLSLPLTGSAEETEPEETEGKTLVISSEERFLHFAESCRLDAYSLGLTVELTADLDLTGRDFRGIPLFLGTFNGNHHRITGLELTGDGSGVGLFRYLEAGSTVKNLTVSGTVAPGGTSMQIGGIAGVNKGTITGCRFDGVVAGLEQAGGIAGVNTLGGTIENCQVLGSVTGDHFSGGITGENNGVILNCVNRASVNAVPRENKVNVTNITIETITGTEAPNTVTDMGGIAGTSVGVIRDCINRGQIGYLHMGYNIGGIAGSQVGYITGCQNYGQIYGRKEAGGIAGQFEPISIIEYQIDTLQILEKQLSSASSLLNRASYNAQSNIGAVGQNISDMLESSEDAREAIEQLKPENKPDEDSFIAAHNAIKNSIHSMHTSMENISGTAGAMVGQLNQDIRAVSSQLNAMSQTIKEANEHMGITLSDVSDQDTQEDFSGKISDCQNFGPVNGDLNAGGIAGSMAYENDLDPEDDLKIYGDRSLNFEGSLRAVIVNCENRGTVTAKKMNAGGIVGFMPLGLVKDSVNTGMIRAEKAQHVGGIAGTSRGYLRSCYVKCQISASTCAGGIAGSGTVVTDCLSMVTITQATEQTGAILGLREAPQNEELEAPVKNNLYMSLSRDLGAIDGISYRGIAEPLAPYKFQNLPHLPQAFRQVKLVFHAEDGSPVKNLELPIGDVFHPEDIPEVPQKEGYTGVWENMDAYVSQRVYFDMVFTPLYTPHRMTVASIQTRENGRPILLAEGTFSRISEMDLKAAPIPTIGEKEILEAWTLPRLSQDRPVTLHFNLPPEADAEHLEILVCREDGSWEPVKTSINARHLVFTADQDDLAFCLAEIPDRSRVIYAAGGGGLLILLILIRSVCKRKKRRASAKKQEPQDENNN